MHERALLDRHLAGEGPPLLLLAGEPGIGKSRLLQEAATRGASAGWQVLRAGCARSGGQLPFMPILQALQRHIGSRPATYQRAALRGCAWLVRLLPELADHRIEPLPTWGVSPEQERRLMFEAVGRYLANVAGPAGTLLLLDDLQWAGADALDLLTHLVRETAALSLRVVGTFRDTEVTPGHSLGVMLADLAEAQRATCVRLWPLSRHEAEELFILLRGGPERAGPGTAAQAVQRVGGVPFFLVSYARSLEDQAGGEPAARGVPWDLQQSLLRRLMALPEAARALVSAAAVSGRVARRSLLLAVLARPEPVALDALESACQAGLLEEIGDDAYGFVHDVIREVAEGAIGQARRAVLHRRIAEALEGGGGAVPASLLAYHYGRGDQPERAVGYLERAGDAARDQAAHDAAAQYYREVGAQLDGLGRVADAARVWEKLGMVLHARAHYTQAIEAFEQAGAALRLAGDTEAHARVEALIGRVHFAQGTLQEGVDRLQQHVAAFGEAEPSRGLADLSQALAGLYILQGRFRAAQAEAVRAAETARALGDSELLAKAEQQRGTALWMTGQDEEALAAFQTAADIAEATGNHPVRGGAAQFSALIFEERGEFARARQSATRQLASGERSGDLFVVQSALHRLAAQAYFTGAWREARGYLARTQALPDRSPTAEGGTELELGRLCMAEGAWEQAAAHLEASIAAARSLGVLLVERTAQCLLAERDLLDGRPEAALARVLPLGDREGLEERMVTNYVLPALAWAYLDLGEVEQAERTIAEALRRQRAGRHQLGLVGALRVQAQVAIRQGQPHTAQRALEEGLLLARATPYPHGEGRLLEVYGSLHLACGEVGAARERLEAALAVFQRLGAHKDVERVACDLVALHRQPRA